MSASKRQPEGQAERLTALESEFDNLHEAPPSLRGATLDDLIDATAAAWTARRIAAGTATILGQGEVDATGYPMSIWA